MLHYYAVFFIQLLKKKAKVLMPEMEKIEVDVGL
jgi:hypothetical protein